MVDSSRMRHNLRTVIEYFRIFVKIFQNKCPELISTILNPSLVDLINVSIQKFSLES